MLFWSIVMILAIGMWRLRQWSDIIFVSLITAIVLFISHMLFLNLSLAANLDPALALQNPLAYLQAGLFGWLALLVMPCGWLGPIIGLNLVLRRDDVMM
jgi:hypothetical protein